ncbi:hypothetical protein K466DRAFT_667622 [Polyporus arcularius HHB13444]|uniref:Uncharacterized protein n=1 Tax=Polyporus arcularius HHB13444 TaxID=1314778 RepID=A0A5C3NUR5_9APHY|nr:hypothetical protein K466DRAFT_667622 [Polyporus arcularius HHB13444]
MRMAKQHILHADEFVDAESAIHMIKDGLKIRRLALCSIFWQRRLVVPQELGEFAHGIFKFRPLGEPVDVSRPEYREGDLWNTLLRPGEHSNLEGAIPIQPESELLKYPPHLEEFYLANEDGLQDCFEPQDVDDSITDILGAWTGVILHDTYGSHSLMNLHFHASSSNPTQFVAMPLLANSWKCCRTTLTGERTLGLDGDMMYAITVESDIKDISPTYLRLRLSDDGLSLRGVSDPSYRDGSLEVPPGTQVVMKRTSTQAALQHYPSPAEFAHDKPRALWRFAIYSILHAICSRGTNISWPRVAARRAARRRFASILYLESTKRQLSPALRHEGSSILKHMQPADYHFAAYAAIEPSKFPWLLPSCSVQGPNCQTLLPDSTLCIRCCSPQCLPPIQQYDSHGFVICEDSQCLKAHESSTLFFHCVVKTRTAGWTIDKFEQATGKGFRQLRERAEHLQVLLTTDREDSVPSRDTSLERSRLTTNLRWEADAGRSGTNTVDSSRFDEGKRQRVRFFQETDEQLLPPGPEDTVRISSAGSSGGTACNADALTVSGLVTLDVEAGISAVDVAQSATSDARRGLVGGTPPGGPPPTCLICKEKITPPCWTCAECTDKLICICTTCEVVSPFETPLPECAHEPTHTLLHISPPPSLPPPHLCCEWIWAPASDTKEPEGRQGRNMNHAFNAQDDAGHDAGDNAGDDADEDDTKSLALDHGGMGMEERFRALEEGMARMERMLQGALSLAMIILGCWLWKR